MIHHGDNLSIMRGMGSGSVDLIATDPPFCTGKDFDKYDDRWIWNDARLNEYAGLSYELSDSIDLICRTHSNNMGAFICFLAVRLLAMHRVLKPTGSIFIHCDPTANAYIRMAMDAIFGARNFRNEIVWSYGLGGSSPRMYSKKHDTILFFTKSKDDKGYYFDKPKVPATSQLMKGQMKGQPDVFTDIPSLNNMALERAGYPTQKPIALYERIIKASCPVDGIVLDPFMGSGTTLVAAKRLGRVPIGIDESAEAIAMTIKRLQDA